MPFLGNINVAGDVVVPVEKLAFGYWLRMLLGDPTSVSIAGSRYRHTFKVGESLDSWVLEQQYRDIAKYQKFNGCKANSLRMTVGGDGELVATIGIIGGKETAGDSSIDAHPILLSMNRFHQFSADIYEGGALVATIQSLDFTITNNLDESVYVIGGDGFRNELPEGIMKVSGNIKAMFQDWVLYNKAVAGTESSIIVQFVNGSDSLVFTFPELMYGRNAPGIEGPGGVWITMPFEAYYEDGADQSALKVELVNTLSTYASISTSTTSTTSTTTSSTTTTTHA
jgi:hypothetical protein